MDSRYHVVCLVYGLGMGGTENGVVNLLNRMDPERFRFTLVLLDRERDMLHRVERGRVEVVSVPRGRGRDPLFPLKLSKVFRRLGADLLHSRGFSCIEGIPAARLAGVPAVLHSEHGREVDEAHRMKPRRAFLRSLLYPMADAIVTVSEELGHWLAEQSRIPRGRLVCLPNGVDLDRFADVPDRAEARRSLGLDEDARWVGSLGRLEAVKDYGSLLRAMARLAPEHADARLLLVGDGEERRALESAAGDLGIRERVEFTGWRDDLPVLLAALDAFVLPSVTEGMSNALLEAMAAGVPSIATDVGGNAQLVRHDETGLLVPPADPDAMRDALDRLLGDADLRTRLGDAGRSLAETQFSLGAMVARYEDLYVGLIEKGRCRAPETRGARSAPAVVPADLATSPGRAG